MYHGPYSNKPGCPQRNCSSSSHRSRIRLDGSDLQRELRALIFLPEDHGDQHSEFCRPDLRMMIRMVNIELSDQSHQERLCLHDAIQRAVFSVPGESIM